MSPATPDHGAALPAAHHRRGGGPGWGEEEGDEEAADWACLTEADVEADLAECEEAIALAAKPTVGTEASEDKLRLALRRGVAAPAATFDADIFFAAPRALQGIAAELQEVLAEVETLRFEAASLVASLAHGLLRPPQPVASGGGALGAGSNWVGLPAREVFGLGSSPPAKPPALELSPPAAAAGGLADYQRRLEALPRVLVIERRVRMCMGEVDKYQDGKDISRDELIVNGLPVSGAKGGYAAAVEAIASGLKAGEENAAWRPEATERAAQLMLSILNRTSSGFAAFEEVLRLFDCPDVVIVSPDSAAARPLEAAILGGCALGRAHTRYAIRRADSGGDEAPLAVVDCEFAFRLSTGFLGQLVEKPRAAQAWPSEEISAAVLLRRL